MQSRRFEARRGLGEAATPRTQNVLAQGQSEAHGDSKLYNTIVEVPASAELFVVGACAAKPKKYRMKQSWRQASMQVLNSSVARPWKKEHNTSGQASRQASRASRPWKLEQNNMTQKGPFFGPQNVRKSRRAKMGLPSSRFQPPSRRDHNVRTEPQSDIGRNKRKKKPSRRDHFWFQAGPLSDPFWNTFLLHGVPKLDPQQVESGASLKVRF